MTDKLLKAMHETAKGLHEAGTPELESFDRAEVGAGSEETEWTFVKVAESC